MLPERDCDEWAACAFDGDEADRWLGVRAIPPPPPAPLMHTLSAEP